MYLYSTWVLVLASCSTCWSQSNTLLYKLPGKIKPIHYELNIKTYLDTDDDNTKMSFMGEVIIEVECKENTDSIRLNSKGNDIQSVSVSSKSDRASLKAIKSQSPDLTYEFYTIDLNEDLVKGEKYIISLTYKGTFDQNFGYMRREYTEGSSKKYMTFTQFEPTYARTAFPCFDEPAMKATFDIKLGHQSKYNAFSNMPQMGEKENIENEAGMVWTRFERTPVMSTYLVAFSINEYSITEEVSDGIQFRILTKSSETQHVQFALEEAKQHTKFFEQLYSMPYGLPKQDHISIPNFVFGAMENWGLITYKETSLLIQGSATFKDQEDVSKTIAHEIAHQWFGNLVTMSWWDDLWLNEAFATYMATYAVDNVHPLWKTGDMDVIRSFQYVFFIDSLQTTHAVATPVEDPRLIIQKFDVITYAKGRLLVRMMKLFLGDDVFVQGLRRYLSNFDHGNAVRSDLWRAMADAQGNTIPVATIMNSWIEQKGYPVIIMSRNGDVLNLEQQQYLRNSSATPSGCWWIPITYTTQVERKFEETNPITWFSCLGYHGNAIMQIPAPPTDDWILLNIRGNALYRVAYHSENWDLLAAALKTDNFGGIEAVNRLQLIEDSFNLASTNHVSFDQFFKIIEYLRAETEVVVWDTAESIIFTLHKYYQQERYSEFEAFAKKLFGPAYTSFGGFTKKDNPSENKLRTVITTQACRYNVQDCVDAAKEKFRNKNYDVDDKEVVYCTVIANDDAANSKWNQVKEDFLKNKVSIRDAKLHLKALTCTRNSEKFRETLELLLSSDVIEQSNAASAFWFAGRTPNMFTHYKDFVMSNFGRICEKIGRTSMMAGVVTPLVGPIRTLNDLTEVQRLFVSNIECLDKVTDTIARDEEKSKLNIVWLETYFDDFTTRMNNWSY